MIFFFYLFFISYFLCCTVLHTIKYPFSNVLRTYNKPEKTQVHHKDVAIEVRQQKVNVVSGCQFNVLTTTLN